MYKGEHELAEIISLMEKDLSEPYTVYTYRYFIHSWPQLTIITRLDDKIIGVVIGRIDTHRSSLYGTERKRGYIAMLAVDKSYRGKGLGSSLVSKIIDQMKILECDEIALEAEHNNTGALALYTRLGFIKDKRLKRYYMNGVDAFRLKLFITGN